MSRIFQIPSGLPTPKEKIEARTSVPATLQDFLQKTRGLLGRRFLFGCRIGGTDFEDGMNTKGTPVPRPTPPLALPPRVAALEIPQEE